MRPKINYKKAIIWGIVILIIQMVIGNLLYMNAIVSGIYEQYAGHPSTKAMDYFGGQGNWVLLMSLSSIILIIIFIVLYLVLYSA